MKKSSTQSCETYKQMKNVLDKKVWENGALATPKIYIDWILFDMLLEHMRKIATRYPNFFVFECLWISKYIK